MLLPLLCLLPSVVADTVAIRSIGRPPAPGAVIDSVLYGAPQLQLKTRQGVARIWFLRAADTVFVAATIPDSTPYWGDDFVLSIDTKGDGGDSPRHDDFQFDFRRVLDSSVVFRGRLGRWEPPKGDPDWRLGAERSGGGWEVSARDGVRGWNLLVRLDPAWLEGAEGRLPRLAVRIFDDDPQGWFAWPLPNGTPQAWSVERIPDLWAVVASCTSPTTHNPDSRRWYPCRY